MKHLSCRCYTTLRAIVEEFPFYYILLSSTFSRTLCEVTPVHCCFYNCSDVLTFVHLAPQTMFRKISPLNCNTIMHSVIFRDNIYTKSSTPLLSVLQQVLSLATIAITTTTCLFLSMMMVLLL